MKVLLLSTDTGSGHVSASRAICEAFEKKGYEAEVADFYGGKAISKFSSDYYDFSSRIFPPLYSIQYALAKMRSEKNFCIPDIVEFLNILYYIIFGKDLRKKFMEADIVICSHVFPAYIIDFFLTKLNPQIVTVGIITDFTILPYWHNVKNFDVFITANELLTSEAIKNSIPKEKVYSLGIPVLSKFNKKYNKEIILEKLGLDKNKKTVLVLPNPKIVQKTRELLRDKSINLIVVCGSDKKSYEQLRGIKFKKLRVFGFTKKVDILMSAADEIFTKAGALTLCECFAKGFSPNKNLNIISPLPGQEKHNCEFIEKHKKIPPNMLNNSNSANDIAELCLELYSLYNSVKKI